VNLTEPSMKGMTKLRMTGSNMTGHYLTTKRKDSLINQILEVGEINRIEIPGTIKVLLRAADPEQGTVGTKKVNLHSIGKVQTHSHHTRGM